MFVSHRFARKLADAQVPFKLHVVVGPVDSEEVAKVVQHKAEEIGAVLIVMARHNKGKLKELWVGSCTKALVQKASVPVVAVPSA